MKVVMLLMTYLQNEAKTFIKHISCDCTCKFVSTT